MAKKTTAAGRGKGKKPARARGVAAKKKARRRRVDRAKLRKLAASGETMGEAAKALRFKPDELAARFRRTPALVAVWERGREICNLGRASIAASVEETARALDMTPSALRKKLRGDPELRDTRRQARVAMLRQMLGALHQAATKADNPNLQAARELLKRLQDESEGGVNVHAVRQVDLLGVLGITRPTIGQWGKRGCPRNEDRTYDLAAVVQWKLGEEEEWRKKKTATENVVDRAQARKAEAKATLMEMELAEKRGVLLPRAAVVAGQVARIQTIKATLLAWIRRLPGSLEGRGRPQISQTLKAEVYRLLGRLAAGLRLELSPAAAEVIRKEMQIKKPRGGGKS